MTIDKMKRAFLTILLIFICALLVACSRPDDGLDEFEQLLNENSGSSEQTEERFAEMVYVVIPQGCSAQLSAKAGELAAGIKTKTGVTASVKYDNESTVEDGRNLEILVGGTNRLRSKEILKDFRLGEYICCWDRGCIILGGRHEDATLTAIDSFIESVLHGATATSLMGADVRLENRIEYAVEEITLNGYDLYDFTLAYSTKNENRERDIAHILRDYLAKESGYLLDVIPISSRTDDIGKIICIGKGLEGEGNNQLYDAYFGTVGQDISIYGDTSYELSAAVADFAERITANVKDKKANLDVSFYEVDTQTASVNVCSAFFTGQADRNMIFEIASSIRSGEHDIIAFSQMSADVAQNIEDNRDAYEYYEITFNDGSVFPIVYNGARIKEVECESENGVITVEFKSSADGKAYSFVYLGAGASVDAESIGGYGIVAAEGMREGINGFELVASDSLSAQSYTKELYLDTYLVLDEEVACQKNEYSGWSSMLLSATVRAKYCEDFLKLKNAS